MTAQGNTVTDEKVVAVPLVFLWSNDTEPGLLRFVELTSELRVAISVRRVRRAEFPDVPPSCSRTTIPRSPGDPPHRGFLFVYLYRSNPWRSPGGRD